MTGYTVMLTFFTRKKFPHNWAATQVGLGNAYLNRIKGDRARNIEKAIAAYSAALSVYTYNAFPKNWAATQVGLGNAYRNRIEEDRAKNIEKAIAAYSAALSVYTSNIFPQNWAMTQVGLGNAYCETKDTQITARDANYTTPPTLPSPVPEVISAQPSPKQAARNIYWFNWLSYAIAVALLAGAGFGQLYANQPIYLAL